MQLKNCALLIVRNVQREFILLRWRIVMIYLGFITGKVALVMPAATNDSECYYCCVPHTLHSYYTNNKLTSAHACSVVGAGTLHKINLQKHVCLNQWDNATLFWTNTTEWSHKDTELHLCSVMCSLSSFFFGQVNSTTFFMSTIRTERK